MIPVIDLFAGPGGLNEGFSSLPPDDMGVSFDTKVSFEMDGYACETLRVRETYRQLCKNDNDVAPYFDFIQGHKTWNEVFTGEFKEAYDHASNHVRQLELGESNRPEADAVIEAELGSESDRPHWVLIGGPPCQAYSLAGRSRRRGDETFASDHKHFLYREYLHILGRFKPTVFVMENVKGLLSSKNGDSGMFQTILSDLSHLPGGVQYEIRSLVVDDEPDNLAPSDFIIKAEDYGVPQRRHRVILLGVRTDVARHVPRQVLTEADGPVTVRGAIETMPKLTAAVSRRKPRHDLDWPHVQAQALSTVHSSIHASSPTSLKAGLEATQLFQQWVSDGRLKSPVQHAARAHMVSDLVRYRVLAELAQKIRKSPKYTDLPQALHPDHANISDQSVPFTDRFRVQVWDSPSTTVVSHISKDGHYYIHPDPLQNRSLSVREAARLQSFPDNYFFAGARTHQFHQVGNAVPPLLARQVAELVREMLKPLVSKSQ